MLLFFFFLWRVFTLEPNDPNFNTMKLEVNTHKMSLYPMRRTKKNANKTGGGLLDDGLPAVVGSR